MKMNEFEDDLNEIGQLIMSAAIIQEVRQAVASVMKNGFIVTDGKHHPDGDEYDAIVRCGEKDGKNILRRIRGKIPNTDIKKISDGVLGIKMSRRMRKNNT